MSTGRAARDMRHREWLSETEQWREQVLKWSGWCHHLEGNGRDRPQPVQPSGDSDLMRGEI